MQYHTAHQCQGWRQNIWQCIICSLCKKPGLLLHEWTSKAWTQRQLLLNHLQGARLFPRTHIYIIQYIYTLIYLYTLIHIYLLLIYLINLLIYLFIYLIHGFICFPAQNTLPIATSPSFQRTRVPLSTISDFRYTLDEIYQTFSFCDKIQSIQDHATKEGKVSSHFPPPKWSKWLARETLELWPRWYTGQTVSWTFLAMMNYSSCRITLKRIGHRARL